MKMDSPTRLVLEVSNAELQANPAKLELKDTPIASGFLCFIAVFVCVFLWKGSQLYMQVFGDSIVHLVNYQISLAVHTAGNFLASIMVGVTFLYLAKQLR